MNHKRLKAHKCPNYFSSRFFGKLRCVGIFFFFFKQKTAYEMRISDWSSDVCSSDLLPEGEIAAPPGAPATEAERWILTRLKQTLGEVVQHFVSYRFDHLAQALYEFVWNEYCDWFLELSKPALNGEDAAAAASDRKSVVSGKGGTVRVDHGGRRNIK